MREFLYRLVERLHDEGRPLSRNRHFHAFTGGARKALRIDRHLRDLETQLALLRSRGERPRVRAMDGGRVQFVLHDRHLAVVRTATLTAEEVALLRHHPAGAWALDGSEQPAEQAPAAALTRR